MEATDHQHSVRPQPSGEMDATPVKEVRAKSAKVSAVTSQATRQRLLQYDPTRMRFSIQNDSTTANLYIAMGEEAGNNLAIPNPGTGQRLYSQRLSAGQYWEVPMDFCDEVWGIWDVVTAGDAAMVTEYR